MKYFLLTLRHKWFVLGAGLRIGCPLWRLIKHDWTKFLPCELPHYQRQFFGDASDGPGFIRCWTHHQNHNDHHWEYWVPRTGHNRCDPPYPDLVPIPMPEFAILEMFADWIGASRAYSGDWPTLRSWPWFSKTYPKIKQHIHPATRARVEELRVRYFD